MSQVFFERCKELPQLRLIKLDLRLAERMDQVANTTPHNLASLTPVQSLLLDFTDESFDASQNF